MANVRWDWEGRIGRRVRLRDLHILSAVVRWGSMAKAASHLGMSQSAVSEAIASLEDALGVRLLDRDPHGIEPTIYAEALLKRSNVVFDELMQGIRDIEFLSNPSVGAVRIASPEFLSAWFLPTAIDQLLARYPQVSVRVFQTDASMLELRQLHERNVDLVLNRLPKDFIDDDVDIETLFDDRQFVVTGVQSRWAQRHKIALAELANEPWMLPPSPAVIAVLQETFEAEGLKLPSERVTAASILLRINLLATGRFISVLPESVFRSLEKQVSLKVLPIELRIKAPPVVIIRLKNRTVSPVVQLFIEHLRKVAKSVSGSAKSQG
jgi:DNA-binding transcriptional LysR family regulator